jgi:hypothetical protein
MDSLSERDILQLSCFWCSEDVNVLIIEDELTLSSYQRYSDDLLFGGEQAAFQRHHREKRRRQATGNLRR